MEEPSDSSPKENIAMQKRWMVGLLAAAMVAGAAGAALLTPERVGAVDREVIQLLQMVTQLTQGQQALQTTVTQNAAVEKTLIEQSLDSVNKLNQNMGSLQKSMMDMQANSGARLDSMSTQVQGVSDNLQELLARMGKLNQQLTDTQTAIQSIDAKLAAAAPAPAATAAPAAAPAPSADLLYSNGLRDLNGKKYDLATQEFQDYLKYYADTDLASNAQFYLGEIAFAQQQYTQAMSAYSKVLENYPKSFKLAAARLKKALALIEVGEKTTAIRELRNVVRLYPGSEEDRRARAKLKELGATV
jgi:tol-pal system protein YbgF